MRHHRTVVAAVVLGLSLLWSPLARAQGQCVHLPTQTATIKGTVTAQEAPGTPVFATVAATADIDGVVVTYSNVAGLDGAFSIQVGAPATYVVTAAPIDFLHAPEFYDGVVTTAAAETFSVTPGQEVNDVDFTVVLGTSLS